MDDDERGHAVLPATAQNRLHNEASRGGIHASGRLIRKQQPRVVGQRPGKRCTLTFTIHNAVSGWYLCGRGRVSRTVSPGQGADERRIHTLPILLPSAVPALWNVYCRYVANLACLGSRRPVCGRGEQGSRPLAPCRVATKRRPDGVAEHDRYRAGHQAAPDVQGENQSMLPSGHFILAACLSITAIPWPGWRPSC